MFTSSLLNVDMLPESHKCPIDKSDPVLIYGNRFAWCAARGRPLIGMMPVCVDFIEMTSGSCTWMGLVSGWMLSNGLLVLKKMAVASCFGYCMLKRGNIWQGGTQNFIIE